MSSTGDLLRQQPLTADAPYVLGVDIGGTFIKVGVVDREANVQGRVELPSRAELGFVQFVERIGDAIETAVANESLSFADIAGIGVGYPGTVRTKTGIVSGSPNIPGANGSNFTQPLIDRFEKAVVVGNDASVAAFGECRYGVGRQHGADDLVLFTLGTGVGGGIVIDGHMVVGAHSQGAEMGHMVIDADGAQCGCGNFGCVEAFCGTAGILRAAWRRLQEGRPSLLWDHIREYRRPELTPKMITLAADAGDAVALEVWAEIGYYLGLAAMSAINMLDPELVVFTGQITKAGAPLIESIRRTVRARSRLNPWPVENIMVGALGEDSGVIGAAAVVLDRLTRPGAVI